MSKKPSPKKKYGPRAVAVPHYLNSLTSDVDRSHDARDKNRVFLLQVANRTVEKKDLAMYGRIRFLPRRWNARRNFANVSTTAS